MFISPENFFIENVLDFNVFKLEKGVVTFAQIKSDVGRYATSFANEKFDDFVLYIENDTVLFVTILFALLQAKKRVFLPSSEKMAMDFSTKENLPIITNKTKSNDFLKKLNSQPNVDFNFINMRSGRVCFFTSGSTSAPKMIEKAFATLSDETLNSANLLGFFKDTVLASTCEPFHLYGMLWKILYPMSLSMPIHSVTIKDPETLIAIQRQNQNLLFVTTPSFIEAIARHRTLYKFPQNIVAITTSGGLLKHQTSLDAKEIWNAFPTEIFGSTESGGIASRNRGIADNWKVFPKVKIGVDNRACLNATSPYAINGFFQTNDLVKIENDREFDFLGRIDRLVKIGETQLSIPDIENLILSHNFVENCYVDFAENTLMSLLVLTNEGKKFFKGNGRLKLLNEINQLIRKKFDSKFSLRKIKVINAIPINAQGKILKGEVRKIFNQKMDEPIICNSTKTENGMDFEIFFAPENAYFNGHFSIAKILPGAVQLHFAVRFAQKFLSEVGTLKGVKRLKFSNVILPSENVTLSIKKEKTFYSFTYLKNGLQCSSGVLDF